MKIKLLILSVSLAALILGGCSTDKEPLPTPTPSLTVDVDTSDANATGDEATVETTDAVTSASIVNKEIDFEKAISKNGTWIICLLNDLTFDKDLIVEGDFDNGKDEMQRKIALYTQDEDRNITNRFTLTAPKLTIKSPNASLQHGTFKGDLYVETTDFQLIDANVDGNIYFISDDAKTGFKMDAESSVTGTQGVTK